MNMANLKQNLLKTKQNKTQNTLGTLITRRGVYTHTFPQEIIIIN